MHMWVEYNLLREKNDIDALNCLFSQMMKEKGDV